ncbi:MAG: type II 3-dehydroquinate dehydratase [Bacteroidota bacterium]
MSKIVIINGPNLNLVGVREPEIYGTQTFDDYIEELQSKFPDQEIEYFQSNHEGALIDKMQEVGFDAKGIILNAAGYSHTSIALGDTIKAITSPVVEVHISNIYEREEFRHHSYVTEPSVAHFIGHGLKGYEMAVDFIISHYKLSER